MKSGSNYAAKRLTDDELYHGPILFNGEIYFPSSYDFPDYNNSEFMGKIKPYYNNWIVDLINQDQVIVDKTDENYTHIKTGGGDDATRFTKAKYLENKEHVNEILEKYSKFVLCNDNYNGPVRLPIDKEIIIELENRFGEIEYKVEDFDKYKEIFYIYVNSPSGHVEGLKGEIHAIFDDPIVF